MSAIQSTLLRMRNLAWLQAAKCSTTAAPKEPVKKGQIAKRYPTFVKLEADKTYSWCACGLSKKQPFCDGSHKGKEPLIGPVKFTVNETKKYLICRCKQTNNRPFCDLTHVKTFIPESMRTALKIKL
uniref:Iron-binding zinc finger CDGSH type domain-containing protein n=1 Tax=Amblyomma cajennense TaxID=34607 RepID=A0A023FGR2_AMBCJ